MIPEREKIFQGYPFEKLNPPVTLVEGCKEYDGVIGDTPRAKHNGIDYVRKKGKKYLSFDIFASGDGEAFQGVSKTWGNFVNVRKMIGGFRFEMIYVHLDKVNPKIFFLPKDKKIKIKFTKIKVGEWLGTAGITGNTNGIIQLHFEIQRKNLKTEKRKIIDPYGIYDKASSGKYPQPGESLKGLNHYFTSDSPKFSK